MNCRLFQCRVVWSVVFVVLSQTDFAFCDGPFQATGFKVGEVTDQSAIVWTRLTRNEHRNPGDAPMVTIEYSGDGAGRRSRTPKVIYPDGASVGTIRNAAPGVSGQVRVHFAPEGSDAWRLSDWNAVDPKRDFTRQFALTGLKPDTNYKVKVEGRSGPDVEPEKPLHGTFRTAPAADDPARVVFTVSTGQAYNDLDRPDGYEIYPSMLKIKPSFFVHTGDIVYYDRLAKTEALARYHWQRTYGLPTNVEFHRQVASYFIKDDHDTWVNDCWPTMKTKYMGEFTFRQGLAIFREQVPMGLKTYRTVRWGRDLQVWLVEGRDFRSPNNAPDGPGKTIWGREQMEWFKRTVTASDATFRVLISPTPVVGPDRDSKHDNHANRDFKHEGDQLRDFIASQKNMVVVCGDRHWQYMSVDPRTGVREFSCGPASDKHAGGWKQSDFREDFHKYLNVVGGFLSATVDPKDGAATLAFRWHDVHGKVLREDILNASE